MAEIDYCLVKSALTGRDEECGDTGFIKRDEDSCLLSLVDVLGHGQKAHEVALRAEDFLRKNHHMDLLEMMKGLHLRLKGTRGAVAALVRLDLTSGLLTYTGVGNITARIYGAAPVSLVPAEGIIGFSIATPKIHQAKLFPGDLLVLYSDGIKEHFDMAFYPDLLKGSAKKIAGRFMAVLGKGSDDASCIVLRYER